MLTRVQTQRLLRYIVATMAAIVLFLPDARAENHPSPKSWYRIDTDKVRLIFPLGLERQAQRMVHWVERLHPSTARSLGSVPPKCTMILKNEKVESNAFFTPYPFHIELSTFTTPDYCFAGTSDWLYVVFIHETRHLMQHERLYGKPYHWKWWLCAPAWLNRPPKWWYEGDAVCTETLLTNSGRGRLPHFLRIYKANLMSGKRFSYAKQVLGSFKDKIDSAYPIGYLMLTHLRRNYGAERVARVWTSTLKQLCFYRAFKKAIGKNVREVYQNTNQELHELWSQQWKDLPITSADSVNVRTTDEYIDYLYPHDLGNGRTLSLKEGIGTPRRFVCTDAQGNEQTVLRTKGGHRPETPFSATQNVFVWLEVVPATIGKQYHHALYRYDMHTRKVCTLDGSNRYAAVALSPDASRVAACQQDPYYNHRLVLLDAQTGVRIKTFDNPDDAVYRNPSWSEDGAYILAVKYKDGSASLVRLHSIEGVEQTLMTSSDHHPIGTPTSAGRYILYSSPCKGIDNLYAVDTATGLQYQVTSRKYGAYNPRVTKDGLWILFSDFDAKGMDMKKMPFDPTAWIPLEEAKDVTIAYYEPLLKEEMLPESSISEPEKPYPITRSGFGWMLEREWTPRIATSGGISCSVQSSDAMDWTRLQVHGKIYKGGEQAGLYASYYKTYLKWAAKTQFDTYRQPLFAVSCNLPMHYPISPLYQNAQMLGTALRYHYDLLLTHQLYVDAQQASAQSHRDLHPPRWQQMSLALEHPLHMFKKAYKAPLRITRYKGEVNVGFPGLTKHHHLSCFFSWQKDIYIWLGKAVGDIQLMRASLQYALPLVYPDWSWGTVFYLKRLRYSAAYLFEYKIPSLPRRMFNSYKQEFQMQLWADCYGLMLSELISLGWELAFSPNDDAPFSTGPCFELNFSSTSLPTCPTFKCEPRTSKK